MQVVSRDVPLEHPDFGKAFPCPTCQGPVLEARRQRDAQARVDGLIKSAGLSLRHMYSFEDFYNLPDEMRDGKEQAAECLIALQQQRQVIIGGIEKAGLLLWGTFGVGKTTLGTAALIAEAENGGEILRVKFADLLDDVKDAYGRTDVHAEDVIRAAQRAPMALLDDLGKPAGRDPLTADQQRITHKILEYRNEYLLPTIITTNCSRDQLKAQLTERTFERLRELCHFIEVDGLNLRQ